MLFLFLLEIYETDEYQRNWELQVFCCSATETKSAVACVVASGSMDTTEKICFPAWLNRKDLFSLNKPSIYA